VKIFGCPSTTDIPQIAFQYYGSALHTCFGLTNGTDPAACTGNEVSTTAESTTKCSYLYDELAQPRDLTTDQAMAADADGQTWFLPGGRHPGYAANWARLPQRPNHDNGQNVMYLDGHVKWTDAVYCSHDPADNIFCPNSTSGVQWNPDIDAYLWDGVDRDSRTVQQ
jgi:prepilin-type processing-associated H-X9-DG protein